MLAFASRTHAEAKHLPEAMTCALDGIAMGIQAPRGGSIIPALVGYACEAISLRPTWELVDKVDAKTARTAATRLAQMEKQRWPLVESFEADMRIRNHVYVRSFFHQGSVKKTWEKLNYRSPAPIVDEESLGYEVPKLTLAERSQLLWKRVQIIYYGPRTVLDNSEKCLAAAQERAKYPWGSQRPVLPEQKDPLSQDIVFSDSSFESMEFKSLQMQAQARLLQTYLVLRAYRLEQGSYPTSLEALVAKKYLSAIPTDPLSPTRASLRYRKNADGTMTLWSVGPDAKDDGGKPMDTQDRKWEKVEGYKSGDAVAGINT